MIKSQDRSGWFGASDVKNIIGNRNTKTFQKWWLKKLGFDNSHFDNKYTKAGTMYEHKILDALDIKELVKDKQIIIPELCLRVNLDGNTENKIYEVKTHLNEFKKSQYEKQVWVQMYAAKIKKAYIVSYQMTEAEYKNYFLEIDKERIGLHEIHYNEEWINNIFLPNLTILKDCLIKGIYPKERIA